MKEFDLLATILPGLPRNGEVIIPAGDDCALLDLAGWENSLLFKTDAVVEGVHFTKEADPRQVGHKALARCLSDIAAMAGSPKSALITLAVGKDFDADWVFKLYEGISETARRYGVSITGGETTCTTGPIMVSVALVGAIDRARCVTRAGANVGDAIFVTGELGGSIHGRHLTFDPRIEEAKWLVNHFPLSAMIDLSDGLAGDLRHILRQSNVGGELLSNAIPISRAAKLSAKTDSSAKPPLLAALTDGEDFELLFTLPSRFAVPLLDEWKGRFPAVKLSCIGKIVKEQGLRLRDSNGTRSAPEHGYTHFS
ncbi:MAG: thiamine-phosphate kinase [Verrucomicrobiota bacterium]|nr:thiamine-phosphate kinase [Verrucomicrobiota bacterium]